MKCGTQCAQLESVYFLSCCPPGGERFSCTQTSAEETGDWAGGTGGRGTAERAPSAETGSEPSLSKGPENSKETGVWVGEGVRGISP